MVEARKDGDAARRSFQGRGRIGKMCTKCPIMAHAQMEPVTRRRIMPGGRWTSGWERHSALFHPAAGAPKLGLEIQEQSISTTPILAAASAGVPKTTTKWCKPSPFTRSRHSLGMKSSRIESRTSRRRSLSPAGCGKSRAHFGVPMGCSWLGGEPSSRLGSINSSLGARSTMAWKARRSMSMGSPISAYKNPNFYVGGRDEEHPLCELMRRRRLAELLDSMKAFIDDTRSRGGQGRLRLRRAMADSSLRFWVGRAEKLQRTRAIGNRSCKGQGPRPTSRGGGQNHGACRRHRRGSHREEWRQIAPSIALSWAVD